MTVCCSCKCPTRTRTLLVLHSGPPASHSGPPASHRDRRSRFSNSSVPGSQGPFLGLRCRHSCLCCICYLFLSLRMVTKQLFSFKSLRKIPESHFKGDTGLCLLPLKIHTLLVPRGGFWVPASLQGARGEASR